MNSKNQDSCSVKIVGMISNQGFCLIPSNKNIGLKTWFFTISTFSSGKYRNISCISYDYQKLSKNRNFQFGNYVEIEGELAYCSSSHFCQTCRNKCLFFEQKVNVKKIKIKTIPKE